MIRPDVGLYAYETSRRVSRRASTRLEQRLGFWEL